MEGTKRGDFGFERKHHGGVPPDAGGLDSLHALHRSCQATSDHKIVQERGRPSRPKRAPGGVGTHHHSFQLGVDTSRDKIRWLHVNVAAEQYLKGTL